MVSCFSFYALAAVGEVVAVDDADPRERLALEMRHCLSRCEKLVCGRIELDLVQVQALQRLGTGSRGAVLYSDLEFDVVEFLCCCHFISPFCLLLKHFVRGRGDGGFDEFFHFRAASGDEDGDELGRFLTDGL